MIYIMKNGTEIIRLHLSLTILVIVSLFLILGPGQVVLGQTGDLSKEREPAMLSIFSTRTIPNLIRYS